MFQTHKLANYNAQANIDDSCLYDMDYINNLTLMMCPESGCPSV